MMRRRGFWLPALLGALFFANSRSGRGVFGMQRRGRARQSWLGRTPSRGLFDALFGRSRSRWRSGAPQLFR
jgi:hypothetical protein